MLESSTVVSRRQYWCKEKVDGSACNREANVKWWSKKLFRKGKWEYRCWDHAPDGWEVYSGPKLCNYVVDHLGRHCGDKSYLERYCSWNGWLRRCWNHTDGLRQIDEV